MQTRENCKNPSFGPDLGPKISFLWVLPLLVVRQCSKLSSYVLFKKTNERNLKKRQRTSFGSTFGPPQFFFMGFTSNVIHCCKLSLKAFSRKTNEPNLIKWKKNLVLDPNLARIRPAKVFV